MITARKSLIIVNGANFIHSEIGLTLPKHLQPSDFLAFGAPRRLRLRGFT
jgi:hypothetical protein